MLPSDGEPGRPPCARVWRVAAGGGCRLPKMPGQSIQGAGVFSFFFFSILGSYRNWNRPYDQHWGRSNRYRSKQPWVSIASSADGSHLARWVAPGFTSPPLRADVDSVLMGSGLNWDFYCSSADGKPSWAATSSIYGHLFSRQFGVIGIRPVARQSQVLSTIARRTMEPNWQALDLWRWEFDTRTQFRLSGPDTRTYEGDCFFNRLLGGLAPILRRSGSVALLIRREFIPQPIPALPLEPDGCFERKLGYYIASSADGPNWRRGPSTTAENPRRRGFIPRRNPDQLDSDKRAEPLLAGHSFPQDRWNQIWRGA